MVVEGDFAKEKPTGRHVSALRSLTRRLAKRYVIPGSRITAHNDHASTNCPGPALKRLNPSLRR
ncbi:MAG: peptidoglycan recognition protein family protein [Hyphomicrobiaceae bacterium]